MEPIDIKLIKIEAQIRNEKEKIISYINGCNGSIFYQNKSGEEPPVFEIDLRMDIDMAKMMLDHIGILQEEQYELLKEKFYKTN